MPSPYDEFKRDGVNRLLKLARAMCVLVNAFAAIITTKYRDFPAILALVVAIQNLCQLLPDAEQEFVAIASQDSPIPPDSGDIAGINPEAPPPPDPDVE